MKYRKQAQHIRRYRSGRWTCVNRGIRYQTSQTVWIDFEKNRHFWNQFFGKPDQEVIDYFKRHRVFIRFQGMPARVLDVWQSDNECPMCRDEQTKKMIIATDHGSFFVCPICLKTAVIPGGYKLGPEYN